MYFYISNRYHQITIRSCLKEVYFLHVPFISILFQVISDQHIIRCDGVPNLTMTSYSGRTVYSLAWGLYVGCILHTHHIYTTYTHAHLPSTNEAYQNNALSKWPLAQSALKSSHRPILKTKCPLLIIVAPGQTRPSLI